MKRVAFILSVSLFTFGTVALMQSCKNECKDVVCENGGTCNEDDGSCACVDGYEGTNCETEFRAEALGVFNVSDVVTSVDNPLNAGTYAYESTITAGSSVTEISIGNFGGFGSTIKGEMTDSNTGTISSQTDAAGRKFEGTFTTTSTDVNVTYTVTYTDATTDDGDATFSPK